MLWQEQASGLIGAGEEAARKAMQREEEEKRRARKDDPTHFEDQPQTDVFMAVADTLGYEVKNNTEDYSKGLPNDLATIEGAYKRGE